MIAEFSSRFSFVRRWGWKVPITAVLVVAAVAAGGFFVQQRRADEVTIEEAKPLPEVMVSSFGALVRGATVEKVATIEPAHGAALIARTGGRVTAINTSLGSTVQAGRVVVAIDGNGEPNPARAQLALASASLASFKAIEAGALGSSDQAIATAQLALEAAQAGKRLTAGQVAKSREQADLSVHQAELALQDAQESDTRSDPLIRSADLALQAAALARDQASIARDLANRQTGDATKQTEQGLSAVRQIKEKLVADLASQRVALEAQVRTANEQVRMSQVTAPLTGQVTHLSVRVGDYVRPGQEVGEVVAFTGAQVVINVTTGVRAQLQVGQSLVIKADSQTFIGEVVRLADGPRREVALWQVDIFISSTPNTVYPGDLVKVELPVGPAAAGTTFIPLDALLVRQDGIVLFTVNGEGVISEHAVSVLDYAGEFVEGVVDVPMEAMVVISGNRTLQVGDQVRIGES